MFKHVVGRYLASGKGFFINFKIIFIQNIDKQHFTQINFVTSWFLFLNNTERSVTING